MATKRGNKHDTLDAANGHSPVTKRDRRVSGIIFLYDDGDYVLSSIDPKKGVLYTRRQQGDRDPRVIAFEEAPVQADIPMGCAESDAEDKCVITEIKIVTCVVETLPRDDAVMPKHHICCQYSCGGSCCIWKCPH